MTRDRAWILLPSGSRLNLFEPDPQAWTDGDLAIGLSRTYRWAGYSKWALPLSVAQHSLTVLAIRQLTPGAPLTSQDGRRELLHDATEALLGGWDPITPLKPYLGEGCRALVTRMQQAVDERYDLPPWEAEDYRQHKLADRLAAASEAFHVAGWSREAMREDLGTDLAPLTIDPLETPSAMASGMRPWEPWPARLAEQRFMQELEWLRDAPVPQSPLPPAVGSLAAESYATTGVS